MKIKISTLFFISLFISFLGACSTNIRFSSANNSIELDSEKKLESQSNQIFFGKASFYADKFEGRLTANGEIFSQEKLTAAHRTLKFGTYVKVTNLSNGISVIVRINDRGPFVEGRIIDLSMSAAKQLDMIQMGVIEVKVEILE